MRIPLLIAFLLNCFISFSQTYPAQNITLVSHIDPQSTVGIGTDSRKYSGCWGWFQASKNKEYGIVGSSAGTYFIDISSPATPTVCDYVPGKSGCTWRELKTYQNYCYVVSDDAAPNRFQIIDMQYLPDSVHLVYDGNTTYFERGHTIWIDKDKMYIGSETKQGGLYNSMTVYSLATPTNPVFLKSLATDASFVSIVHDMYVKNDTVFASCGNQGLYIFKFNSSNNTFTSLGSFINYSPGNAYNHASFLTADSKHLIFTDEVPSGLPMRVLNVENISNPYQTTQANPHPQTTPHNPYMVGNRWAILSCYQDGLNIYDMAYPDNIYVAGYFDTHPQGGFNMGSYPGSPYRGNWGAYPFFPSGLILALDMQNGVFVLDASTVYGMPVGMNEKTQASNFLNIYPNPASTQLNIMSNINTASELRIENLLGQLVLSKNFNHFNNQSIDVSELNNGTYLIKVKTENNCITKKIIISK